MRRHAIASLFVALAGVAVLFASLAATPARASLLIEIDKSAQRMTVSHDGATLHRWPVSTGLRAYDTPAGEYTPFRMEKNHFSREWDDAPMPHSIFFTKKGHAIHGTTHRRAIGRPASHGCVRLEPENARVLFDLVRRAGMANTRIVLQGETPQVPERTPEMARRQPSPQAAPRPQELREAREFTPPESGPDVDRRRVPRYIEPRAVAPGYIGPREAREPRIGYWVQYPDGRRVFVDSEYRAPTAPFPQWRGLPGWD